MSYIGQTIPHLFKYYRRIQDFIKITLYYYAYIEILIPKLMKTKELKAEISDLPVDQRMEPMRRAFN